MARKIKAYNSTTLKIYAFFIKNIPKGGLSYTEIKKGLKLSDTVLAKHLEYMQDNYIIYKSKDGKYYLQPFQYDRNVTEFLDIEISKIIKNLNELVAMNFNGPLRERKKYIIENLKFLLEYMRLL